MRILVAGASGFLGTHLTSHLRERGHEVSTLVRRPASAASESLWDPDAGTVDRDLVAGSDVVVNLAGTPTAGNPHSKKWARGMVESRVRTTATLADAIAAAERPPAFVAQNGIGFYGDHGDDVLTEKAASVGDAFLTRLTREWQAATDPAREAGSRVCVMRTAPVMHRSSPPLKQLALLTRLGLGARIGDGQQYFPMVSLRDWLGGVTLLVEDGDASGPFNLCCPETPTNVEFTDALARAVHRKAFLAAPAAVVRVGAGAMANELLGSVRVRPAALEAAGYEFRDRDGAAVVAAGLA